MTASPPVTKQQVEEIVGRIVSEVVGDALQLIAKEFAKVYERFEQIDRRFEKIDERFDAMDKRFDRLEDKLETTAAAVDHHTIDIRQLQRKSA
jgi:DNA anti-recombination protein RmuC